MRSQNEIQAMLYSLLDVARDSDSRVIEAMLATLIWVQGEAESVEEAGEMAEQMIAKGEK